MKKILLFSKYSRMGASSRLRTHQYVTYLEQLDYKVTVSPLFNDKYLKALYSKQPISKILVLKLYFKRLMTLITCFDYDILWIEKELFPYFPAIFERALRLFGVKFIVDYDDAIFHNYDLSSNYLIKRFLGNKIDKVMALSTATVAGNQYLSDRAISAGSKNVKIIPTVVDITRYSVKETDNKKTVVGWIGSPSTQKYVVELLPVFLKLSKSVVFKLVLVGATEDIVDQLTGLDVEVIPWGEDTEVNNIQSMDIGIMPLHNGPWEKGKCGYKLIQYMACGKPVVASKVGANIEIVNSPSIGFLADNSEEFYDCLVKILNDPLRRKSMGLSGRKIVKSKYTVQAQLPALNQVFTAIESETV
ncbi:glycosyltransferase family 4 protein [uncultured Vibrio sp.]|uniref:glycosyltransferase family 4 protein n=1 Tax=uncultured Vibrio sp. TaxID=114054 RepID=UPI002AAB0AFE|nr:glycosyltransferase family 4 protein [uncultured Vibrio sp.]